MKCLCFKLDNKYHLTKSLSVTLGEGFMICASILLIRILKPSMSVRNYFSLFILILKKSHLLLQIH
jgi:hypothetical protein